MEADGIDVVVLPVLPFGPTPEHRGFGAGYVDLEPSLHDAVVDAVLASLANQGFARILVWRGCGGHDLRGAVTRFNRDRSGAATAYLPGHRTRRRRRPTGATPRSTSPVTRQRA